MGPKFGGGLKCLVCNKTVYAAEEIKAIGKSYHKMCFKCVTCNKMLDSTTCTDNDNTVYCKTCYAKQFGPKGYGYGLGAGVLQMHEAPVPRTTPQPPTEPEAAPSIADDSAVAETEVDVSETPAAPVAKESAPQPPKKSSAPIDPDMCARCLKRVYHAEKQIGAGRTWHKMCYRCSDCGKNLDSFASENDGQFYCRGCYAKGFGPKGYGYNGTLQHTQ